MQKDIIMWLSHAWIRNGNPIYKSNNSLQKLI